MKKIKDSEHPWQKHGHQLHNNSFNIHSHQTSQIRSQFKQA